MFCFHYKEYYTKFINVIEKLNNLYLHVNTERIHNVTKTVGFQGDMYVGGSRLQSDHGAYTDCGQRRANLLPTYYTLLYETAIYYLFYMF